MRINSITSGNELAVRIFRSFDEGPNDAIAPMPTDTADTQSRAVDHERVRINEALHPIVESAPRTRNVHSASSRTRSRAQHQP
jgi:hypothetical protein